VFDEDDSWARGGGSAWDRIQQPLRIVSLKNQASASAQVSSSALNERLTNSLFWMIDQTRRKQHSVECPAQIEYLDGAADSVYACWDVCQHFVGRIDCCRNRSPIKQDTSETPCPGAQFEDSGPRPSKFSDRIQLAQVWKQPVKLN